ncbi:schlafen family member 5-like isoform X1 [Panthera pardus]|uniref:Schlafen family member 5-like isoform X1 n=1 Tax=Panthera pardus TaxID=9691 RepID=A0A9V1EDN0_PANPR|nr:schlafen family member 5-like isoform X1 [Panthera pardus]XP_019279505.2 schlafen family member 5-like isoform X1 [Panthera pardus]XP_019279507.2 schlafen family member 5-like isoform X1 [Panthera pardus]XP_053748672.1 schlafen family member 5-like isoform X1 [Panthera pardus]XP_053748673.1 schlafen family member 5-like isoform X1 [Panthera pardus]XP_053748674.1 schlafen family member 5-like isoform X1 [Panthera pardus]XP_053748675.1 schlafen family member 5-like isoform X1 [Panthera pardu
MSLKVDLETNFAECVLNAGKIILGDTQRKEMNPELRKKQRKNILKAICALLNSGGGVVKAEIENKDYNYEIHGVGLTMPSIFKGYLDEMQQGELFLIFVRSWNADASGVRIATLCSNLCYRYRASTDVMDSKEALAFLKGKTQTLRNTDSSSLSPHKVQVGVRNEYNIRASAAAVFARTQLQYLEKLNFTNSLHVEFKMFSTEESQCFHQSLPSCVSAFANTEGGYIFFGVHDETHEVIGCEKEKIDLDMLKACIDSCIRNLPVHHFCTQKHEIKYAVKFLEVHNQGTLHGYVCAVKVEQFCCAVFSKMPSSWQVKDNCVKQLDTKQWIAWMMEADPDLSRFSEMVLALSLSSTTPRSRTVCTHKNFECLEAQQKCYFPVLPDRMVYTPESIYKELFSTHKGLKNLINKEMRSFSQGILIFSRSWAVDVGLQEKQGVICDALLLSQNNTPRLYTILSECDPSWKGYSRTVARVLKQTLVNTGGYTGKLCVTPLIFLLNPDNTATTLHDLDLQIYPNSYNLRTTQHMEALLRSLVIVLLGFRSFLSEELGSEVFSLLTDKQYELLSKNIRMTRELFVHGLPGSGKTILALRIMEKIRNVFHCQPDDILYICENQPLKNFVSQRHVCQAVTRKTFMKNDFQKIKHIIIDEAQNFRTEDGDWYEKAKAITQRKKDCPGILWIFLDYFQTTHLSSSGLPALTAQYPREELTRVIRNADPIAKYLQEVMQEVRENPPCNIPPASLEMVHKAEWAQGIPGYVEIMEYLDMEDMVFQVAKKCHFLFRNGYSPKDIAVLFSKASEVEIYKDKLLRAMRKRNTSQLDGESDLLVQIQDASDIMANNIVLDSVRRFSGLERNIVFGFNLTAEPDIFHNLLLCLASRAKKHLYILKVPI